MEYIKNTTYNLVHNTYSILDNFYNNISEPKNFGPGEWYVMHILALYARNDIKIKDFIYYVKFIIPRLPCQKCREHAIEYLKNNPFKNYINIEDNNGNLIGMFYWIWAFHNTVNKRLNKPIMSWEDAIDTYSNIGNYSINENSHYKLDKCNPHFLPGIWFSIHSLAFEARCKSKINHFLDFIRFIIKILPCSLYINHALEFIKRNPIENYIDYKDKYGKSTGMFYWTWLFHNNIRSSVGKNITPLDEAMYFYLQNIKIACNTC